jgi:hypothetical protein
MESGRLAEVGAREHGDRGGDVLRKNLLAEQGALRVVATTRFVEKCVAFCRTL